MSNIPRVVSEESKAFVRAHADAASIAFHNGTFRICFMHEIPAAGEVTVNNESGEPITQPQNIVIRQPEAEIIMAPDLFFKLKGLLEKQSKKFLDHLQSSNPEMFDKKPEHWR